MSGFSDAYEIDVLDHFLGGGAMAQPTAWWVSLWVGDPDNGGTEVSGGDYGRVNNTSWSGAAAGAASNSAEVDFGTASADWGEVTHFGLHDAEAAGNLMASGTVTDSPNITSGEDVSFAIGDLEVTLE